MRQVNEEMGFGGATEYHRPMANPNMAGVTAAAREAGRILMSHFQSSTLKTQIKADSTEVTDADLASSDFLSEALPKIFSAPVLSEEAVVPYSKRKSWSEYWLIDPLDGTRDFLAGSNEFTLCIAFIRAGTPILGVVLAPALDELYEAQLGEGAYLTRSAGARIRLPATATKGWAAARSRFHDGVEVTAFLRKNKIVLATPIGSALKFGRIAEGSVNLFPRLKGCHEWDVAAGQVIVLEAGGSIRAIPGGGTLAYNTSDAKVGPFVALGAGADFSRLVF